MTHINPVTELVIAVDGIRRKRGGPFVAAALAFRALPREPLFHFTDGRGAPREEFLLRNPKQVKAALVPVIYRHLRCTTLGLTPYCLTADKAPKEAGLARLIAMYWAVRKLADRLRHYSSEDIRGLEVRLLIAGPSPLNSKQFASVTQTVCATDDDWRLQAARFSAIHSFPEIL